MIILFLYGKKYDLPLIICIYKIVLCFVKAFVFLLFSIISKTDLLIKFRTTDKLDEICYKKGYFKLQYAISNKYKANNN